MGNVLGRRGVWAVAGLVLALVVPLASESMPKKRVRPDARKSVKTQTKPPPARRPATAPAPVKKAPVAPPPAPAAVLLDDFESPDWATAAAEGNVISVSKGSGRTGGAVRVQYDLRDSKQWVQISKRLDVPLSAGKALEFWIKGEGKSNALELKLVDADGSVYGVRKSGLTSSPGWTRVLVSESDFTYWWGGNPQLGEAQEVQVAVGAEEGGAGEFFLDDLRLIGGARPALPGGGLVDGGESAAGWQASTGEGATYALTAETAEGRKVLALQYTIPSGQWVSLRKAAVLALAASDALVFTLKLEGGAGNNIELKVVDRDDSTFGRVFPGLAGDGRWHEVRVPVADFQYMWGGDPQLDREYIRHVELAVSGPGGSGRLLLDGIRVER